VGKGASLRRMVFDCAVCNGSPGGVWWIVGEDDIGFLIC
jgi:hypothetical protein